MHKARLLSNKQEVLAIDVLNGLYGNETDFIDIDQEFRVTFVKKAKNNGAPYFRLYFSLNDYKLWSDSKKTRYHILRHMRYYKETQWHKKWKELFQNRDCLSEKYFCGFENETGKFADSYCEKSNTVIEFQHSYIDDSYFNERSNFYDDHGINVVWLFDLTNSNVVNTGNYCYEVLENNSLGFFRISENEKNLLNYPVFIQTKDKKIYKVERLYRKTIDSDLESTIRFFFCEKQYIEIYFYVTSLIS